MRLCANMYIKSCMGIYEEFAYKLNTTTRADFVCKLSWRYVTNGLELCDQHNYADGLDLMW